MTTTYRFDHLMAADGWRSPGFVEVDEEGFFTEKRVTFVYPTTYLVNKSGEILAIREGFLHWDSPEARALITALMNDEF